MERAARAPHAVVISGIRRAGKSTLLAQMTHRIGFDNFYYINFEDNRFFGFWPEDFNDLYRMLVEIFGERKIFFVDEIQNIPDALKYPELPLLRSLYDDVLYCDIAARYQLEAVKALREMAFFLISNPAGKVSFCLKDHPQMCCADRGNSHN